MIFFANRGNYSKTVRFVQSSGAAPDPCHSQAAGCCLAEALRCSYNRSWAARQTTDAPSFYNVANLLLQAGRQIQHDVIQQIVNNPNLDTWQDKAMALATA